MKKILHKDNFRFGWELEYQNSDYGDSDELDYDNGELDEDRYCEAQSEAVSNERDSKIRYSCLSQRQINVVKSKLVDALLDGDLTANIKKCDDSVYEVYTDYLGTLDEGETPDVDYLVDLLMNDCCICDYEILAEDCIECALYDSIEVDTSEFYTYPPKCSELDLPCGLERVSDNSVKGGEIRPISKQTLSNAIDMIEELENNHSFKSLDIDIECSFHIHISNTGIKHSYGENFQRYMYEYLYHNMSKLPSNILQRFLHVQENEDEVTNWCDEYYTPEISNDRYNAIAFRESLGTWEFRFFGNISNANEGILCLNFAKDCYMYAYNKVHIDKTMCKFERVCSSIKGKARELTGTEDREVDTIVVQPSIFTYVDAPVEPITLSEVTSGVLSPRILMPEGVILDERIDYRLFEPRGRPNTSLCEALGLVQANAPTNTHTVTLDEAMTLFPANAPDLPNARELVARQTEEFERERRRVLQREFYRIIVETNNDRTGT